MASLLRAAQDRARAKRERRIPLEVPGGTGVSLVCLTVTGEQIARLARGARKRYPGDEFMQGLSANTALLAEATVEIAVDYEPQEDGDGDLLTFKSPALWEQLDPKPRTAAEAVVALVGRDGDINVLAGALMSESGFTANGSPLAEDENPPT